jgi:hypothetical protein
MSVSRGGDRLGLKAAGYLSEAPSMALVRAVVLSNKSFGIGR